MRRMTAQDMEDLFAFFGGSEKLKEELAQHRRNIEWLEENYQDLLRKHPNHWVVVLVGDEGAPYAITVTGFSGVSSILDQAGILRRVSVVQYLDPNPKPLILQALFQ